MARVRRLGFSQISATEFEGTAMDISVAIKEIEDIQRTYAWTVPQTLATLILAREVARLADAVANRGCHV